MSRRFQPKDQHGRIIKMSPVNSNWMFTSMKNNSVLFLQTENEYLFCFFLEFDTRILNYVSQPPKIKYHIDQDCHEYTADFFVTTFSHGSWYFEIKSESFDISAHRMDEEKYGSIEYDLKKLGYKFCIIDDLITEKRILLENMRHLNQYRKSKINKKYLDLFKVVFSEYGYGSIKLKALIKIICKLTGDNAEVVTYEVFSLVSKGIIEFNVNEVFSTNVLVRFANEDSSNIWNAVPLQ